MKRNTNNDGKMDEKMKRGSKRLKSTPDTGAIGNRNDERDLPPERRTPRDDDDDTHFVQN